MHHATRGTIVGDAHGVLFVVWGVKAGLVSLMPVVKVGHIRRVQNVVRVRAEMLDTDDRILAVNAEERRHVRCDTLMVLGTVAPPGVVLLHRDVANQAREAEALRVRGVRAKAERRIADTIRKASERRLFAVARQIASEMWPEQMAA